MKGDLALNVSQVMEAVYGSRRLRGMGSLLYTVLKGRPTLCNGTTVALKIDDSIQRNVQSGCLRLQAHTVTEPPQIAADPATN